MAQSEVGYIFPEDAAKQVVEVGNAIQKTDTALLKYTEDAAKLINLLKQQNISFEQLQKVQAQTVETTQKLDAIGKQLIQSEEKLKQVSDTRTEQIIKNRVETAKATQAIKDKLKANTAEEGSLVRMRQRLKELTEAYDKSGQRTKAAAKEINDLSKQIGKAEAATNRHQRNVGNYTSAFDKFKNVTSLLPGTLGNVTSSAEGVITKLASLGPVGITVAGTIAAAGAQVAAFFLKTEKGAELLERKWAGMKAAFNVLVGELASGGEKIVDSWDKVQEQSTFWTKTLSIFGIQGQLLGTRMDLASTAAEKYTGAMQDVQDIERELIVPRAKANDAIAKGTELYNDATQAADKRRDALKSVIAEEDKIADAEIANQHKLVLALTERNKLAKDAGTIRDEQLKELEEATAKEIALDTESTLRTNKTKKRIATLNKEIADQETERQEKLKKQQAEANKKLIEAAKTEQEIERNSLEEIDKLNQEATKKEEEREKAKVEEQNRIDDFNFEQTKKRLEEEVEIRKQKDEQELKDLKDKEAIKQAIQDASFEAATMLNDELTSRRIANIEKEFAVLEMQKEAELSNVNLTATQKQQIEEKYAKKAAELKTKQAKAEKEGAIFSSIINTAVAVVKALPNIPLSIIAGAMGLLQTGLIIARPIPKFAKGTDYAPSEFIAGEAGRELIKTKSGDLVMANKATHFKGNRFKGATIYTNKETEQIINESGKGNNFVFDTRELRDGLKAVEHAIEKKPIAITDGSGRVVGTQSGNYRETYLNRMRNGR